jgi:4-methylaminobutanoate oxidase (formaldehyde-forming)
MVDQARVVVIGGGIAGVSVALHLARAGWREIVLLEKGVLTAGSTSQAAGLVTAFNPSATMMAFRRYSIDLYRELGVFTTVGSVRLASSPERWLELQRGVSRARGIGLEVELLGTSTPTRRPTRWRTRRGASGWRFAPASASPPSSSAGCGRSALS